MKYDEIRFEVDAVRGKNPDGKARQELLREFYEADEQGLLTFNWSEPDEHGLQYIEIMLDGKKVGELRKDDYELYRHNIHNAREAYIKIYEEEDEDGGAHYTADAVMVVPYLNSPSQMASIEKRKKYLAIGVAIFLILYFIFHLHSR